MQSNGGKASLPEIPALKLPSEVRAEQLRPVYDRVILSIAVLISLLGLFGMLGLYILPGISPWSSPLGIFFLGIAMATTLTDHSGVKPFWYKAARAISLFIPASIGAYYLFLYLEKVDFSWVQLFSENFNHLDGPAAMGTVNLMVAPLSLFLFLVWKQSPKIVLYVIGVLTLIIFDLGLLTLIGHLNQIHAMYGYKMTFPNSIAYLLSSAAILIATIPYRGLLLPTLSGSSRARTLAYCSLFLGVSISILGFQALALSLIYFKVTDFNALSTELKELYILSVFACVCSCVLVKILGLRATYYYGGSLFLADLQKQAIRNEQVRSRQLENVTQLNHLALSGVDSIALFNKCTQLVCETLGLKFAKVLERAPGTKDHLIFRTVQGFSADLIGVEYDKGNEPHGAYTLQQLEPVVVEDIQRETRFSPSPLHLEYNLVSGITAVIYGKENQPFGVLQADSQEKKRFTENDVLFMQAMANVLGLALERKRVEQAVIESEERFRTMADAAPNLVWTLNPDGSLVYMNKAGLDLFGVSMEKLIEDSWPPYVHPDDLEKTSQLLSRVMETKTMFQAEYRVKDASGNYHWLLSSANPTYLPNGELHGYIGSSVDINQRKQAED